MSSYPPQNTQKGLNPIQLMLLKLFNRDMSEQETKDIRDMLLSYLDEKMQIQIEKDILEKGITQADFDRILNEE